MSNLINSTENQGYSYTKEMCQEIEIFSALVCCTPPLGAAS